MPDQYILPLTLHYRPSLAEQIEAARRYQSTTRKHRIYRIVSILAAGAAVWTLATAGFHLLAIVWLALALYTWFDPLPLLVVWMSFAGQATQAPYGATFDNDGITFEIAGQRLLRPWERYTHMIETPNVFVLIYGNWAYSVIPRRAIGDSQAQADFHALLQRKIART